MWLIVLEALVASVLMGVILWWSAVGGRRGDNAEAPAPSEPSDEGGPLPPG